MKKLTPILLFSFTILLMSCEKDEEDTRTEWECGTHNGNTLFTGPRDGCYYYNSNGNKTYVDREECRC